MSSIEDDAQIRALIAKAAHLADEGSVDDYHLIYTPDATWSSGGSTQSGLEEITASSRVRRAEGRTGPGAKSRHIVTPVHVAIDGDRASAVSYLLFLGKTDAAPEIRMFAVYDDELVRTPDGWRITKRVNRRD